MKISFDDIEIDATSFVLKRSGAPVKTEPLIFDLMLCFARNAGAVLTRSDLIEQVWGGRIVSDATISSAVKAVRQALGDSGDQQKYIETVRSRGFRFKVDIKTSEPLLPPERASESNPLLLLTPLQCFGSPELISAISIGLAENYKAVLTRIPLLKIISLQHSEEQMTPEQAKTRFGASHILHGSTQEIAGVVRISLQLLDASDGIQIWSQYFEHPNTPEALDDITARSIEVLEPQLIRAMLKAVQKKGEQKSAKEYLLEATCVIPMKGWHQSSFKETEALLLESISQDPTSALGHSYLSLIKGLGHRIGLMDRTDEMVASTVRHAETALELDGMDSTSVGYAACALADVGQIERGIPLLRRAISLNPNNAQAYAALGAALFANGDADGAIQNLDTGIRISPKDNRLGMWLGILAAIKLVLGRYQEALVTAQQACEADDKIYFPRVVMTSVYINLGDSERAKRAMHDCLRVKPDLTEQEVMLAIGRKLGAAVETLRRENTLSP